MNDAITITLIICITLVILSILGKRNGGAK